MLNYTQQGPGMEAAGEKSGSEKAGKGLMAPITPGLVLKAKQRFDLLGNSQKENSGEKQERMSRETPLAGIWEWRDAACAGIHSLRGIRSNSP